MQNLRIESIRLSQGPKALQKLIQLYSNTVGYPVFLGAITLSAAINSFNNLAVQKGSAQPVNLSPWAKRLLDLSFLNGNLDLLSALGDFGQAGSVIGNLMRATLNYVMTGDEKYKVFANQLFQLVAFLIKASWAVTESNHLSAERHGISSFGGKLKFELNNQVDWLKSFFSPGKHKAFWQEISQNYREKGFTGLKNSIGHHTPGMISASAWTGLFATGVLLLGGLQAQRSRSEQPQEPGKRKDEKPDNDRSSEVPKRNLWQKIGWFGIQLSMGMLTISYLQKVLSKDYWNRNRLPGAVLSGLTLATQGFAIRFTDNPHTGQFWRVIYDFFSRLEALLNRHNHSAGHMNPA